MTKLFSSSMLLLMFFWQTSWNNPTYTTVTATSAMFSGGSASSNTVCTVTGSQCEDTYAATIATQTYSANACYSYTPGSSPSWWSTTSSTTVTLTSPPSASNGFTLGLVIFPENLDAGPAYTICNPTAAAITTIATMGIVVKGTP